VSVGLISFARFAAAMAERFGLDAGDVVADSGLWDELGLDSFDALGLIILVEEAADVMYTPFDIPALFTVGDAYRYYESLVVAQTEADA
jgi:acyl carrier protein